jgi:hypothetical protein
MAGKNNSLIDTEFSDDSFLTDDPFVDPHEQERAEFEAIDLGADDADAADAADANSPDGKKKPAKGEDPDKIEIEVVDDTPNKDKGKWVANPEKDGEPDIPNDEELTSYSEKVQKRLSGMTARIHAERRRAEEKERLLQEAVTLAQRYIQENNELKGVVESGEKVLLGEHKGRLEGQLQAARAAYREASEAGDTNGVIAAQEKIAQAVAAMERLNGHRPQQLARANPEELKRFVPTGQNGQQIVRPSDRALEWRKNNAWFDSDIPMQAYALAVHQQLAQQGVQLDSDDYYKRIDGEMRRRFPDRFERQNAPRRQPTNVASGRSNGGSPRRVTLTETQVRIAKRLGLTAEQMARQILKEQENGIGKDFTHTKRT